MFLSTWTYNNVNLVDGIAEMSLSDSDKNYGSEVRTNQGFLYGYFGGRLKAFARPGTVQSIFTYNGGDYDHDEIDIEILGKDTTKVQFNYYHDGVGGHEYIYDLGFDASLGYHDYGFKWDVDKITWFVDYAPVYQVEASLDQWGFLYSNVWAGNNEVEGISYWLDEYTPSDAPSTMYLDYLSYAPMEESGDILLTSPLSNEVVQITDEPITKYIKAFHKKGASKENDYLLDINEVNTTDHTPRVSDYYTGVNLSGGKPVELTFETNKSGPYKVYVSQSNDFTDAKVIETSSKSVSLYNLKMVTRYYWKVETNDGSFVSNIHSFVTADTVRLIHCNKTRNVRDVGGKMTRSGKRIKQGLIYRGKEINQEAYTDPSGSDHSLTLDEASKNTFINELGIVHEIDLRSHSELKDGTPAPSIEGLTYWNNDWVPAYKHISRDTNNLSNYKNIFKELLKVENGPIYIHCVGGLDRTGTVCFVLEGLLGVSFTDICIDYEVSTFSKSVRERDVDIFENGSGFKTMITQLVENTAASSTYPGYNPNGTNDIQEICTNLLLKAGLTNAEITKLQTLLLED